MMKLLFIAVALAAAAPIPALAQTPTEIHVTHADLDLATPAGQAVLDRRIASAAAQFCLGLDSLELARRAAAQRCQHRLTTEVATQRNRVIAAAAGRRDVAALNAVPSTSRAD